LNCGVVKRYISKTRNTSETKPMPAEMHAINTIESLALFGLRLFSERYLYVYVARRKENFLSRYFFFLKSWARQLFIVKHFISWGWKISVLTLQGSIKIPISWNFFASFRDNLSSPRFIFQIYELDRMKKISKLLSNSQYEVRFPPKNHFFISGISSPRIPIPNKNSNFFFSPSIPWKLPFDFSPRPVWFRKRKNPLSIQLFKSFRMIDRKPDQRSFFIAVLSKCAGNPSFHYIS